MDHPVGHPTILSKMEESCVVLTLRQVAEWGFPLTKEDVKTLVKKYLDRCGVVVPIFRSNVPGEDFILSSGFAEFAIKKASMHSTFAPLARGRPNWAPNKHRSFFLIILFVKKNF